MIMRPETYVCLYSNGNVCICINRCPFTLIIILAGARAIKVSGHQHRWLAGGYDLEIGHF